MNNVSYSSIVSFRNIVTKKFPTVARKSRNWRAYPCEGKVLSFGSGKKTGSQFVELKSIYKNIVSCDSDPEAEADYRSIEDIQETFDLIIAEHVLEHIDTDYFVNTLSQKISSIANNNCKLLITVPNLYCYGTFFSDFDHKNLCGSLDIACVLCAHGFALSDYYRWSKMNYMEAQNNFSETERFLEQFIEKNYGLQTDRYVTLVFEKNG